jgi:hypothetical protein
MSWQDAFLATSVAIGVSVDDALEALNETDSTASLARTLRTASREARARAMAQHLASVAAELDAMEATWRG